MKRTNLLLVNALLLGACAHDSSDPLLNGAAGADESGSDAYVAATNGETAYNEYCAGCHETGVLGAPVSGDAADWGERSNLWDAVLLDHAITGYLDMPARGGRTKLPDDVVRAAAEYMLRMSFPDMPIDQR